MAGLDPAAHQLNWTLSRADARGIGGCLKGGHDDCARALPSTLKTA